MDTICWDSFQGQLTPSSLLTDVLTPVKLILEPLTNSCDDVCLFYVRGHSSYELRPKNTVSSQQKSILIFTIGGFGCDKGTGNLDILETLEV